MEAEVGAAGEEEREKGRRGEGDLPSTGLPPTFLNSWIWVRLNSGTWNTV